MFFCGSWVRNWRVRVAIVCIVQGPLEELWNLLLDLKARNLLSPPELVRPSAELLELDRGVVDVAAVTFASTTAPCHCPQ